MAETVMVLASHPDDAELGMGGTIAALSLAGHRVVIVDLTDGEPTPFGTPEIRKAETNAASAILGVRERITLDIKNRELFDSVDNRKRVAAIIREYKPAVLFAHYWEDAHPDHVQASLLSDAARFYSKLVKTDLPHEPHLPRRVFYFFGIHLRPKVTPSFVFDISATFDAKIAAVRAYDSQFTKNPSNLAVFDRLLAEGGYWGSQINRRYGEAFVSREQLRIYDTEHLLNA